MIILKCRGPKHTRRLMMQIISYFLINHYFFLDDGFGDRDGGRYGDRDGGRYGDRDRDRGGFGSAAPESGRWERMGGANNMEKTDRYKAAPSDDNQMWDRGFTVDSSRGDRWSDRNDRWGDRRGGDDRWGDRRGGDDRWNDRNDRWNDRRGDDRNERWGDRDRGYGDRDRGYGGGRYKDDDKGLEIFFIFDIFRY